MINNQPNTIHPTQTRTQHRELRDSKAEQRNTDAINMVEQPGSTVRALEPGCCKLPMDLSFYLYLYIFIYLSIDMYVYIYIVLSIAMSILIQA